MALSRLAVRKDASMPSSCFRLLANRWSSSLVKASSSTDPLPSFSLLALSPKNQDQSLPNARRSLLDSVLSNRTHISPIPYTGLAESMSQYRLEAIMKQMEITNLDRVANACKVYDEMLTRAENGADGMYCMPTFNQLISHERRPKKRSSRTRALEGCPQKAGVCVRVFTRAPKKPNSAQRKLAKVRLSNGKDTFAYIPGEGHNLQEHSIVLIRGGRVQDLPGVKFHCIRGVKDLMGLPNRRQGRSKYGAEKPKSG